jgi:hypothetical protein
MSLSMQNRRGAFFASAREETAGIYIEDFRNIFNQYFDTDELVTRFGVAARAVPVRLRKTDKPNLSRLGNLLADKRRAYVSIDDAEKYIRCVIWELDAAKKTRGRRLTDAGRKQDICIANSAVHSARIHITRDAETLRYIMGPNDDYRTKELEDISKVKELFKEYLAIEDTGFDIGKRSVNNIDRTCGFRAGTAQYITDTDLTEKINKHLLTHIARALVGLDNYPTVYQQHKEINSIDRDTE